MDVCVATWARSAPELLTITGDGMPSQAVAVAPPGREPDHGLLAGSGWHAYPGARWQEHELSPGVWECAVFRDPDRDYVRLGQTNRLVT